MLLAAVVLTGGTAVLGIVLGARWLDARVWARSLVAYRLRLPRQLTVEAVAAWLGAVAATRPPRWSLLLGSPLVLEVTATSRGVQHHLLVPETRRGAVLGSLRAALPGVAVSEAPEYLADAPKLAAGWELALTSVRRPLAHARAEPATTALLAALQPLPRGAVVRVQWTLVGTHTPHPAKAEREPADAPWWWAAEEKPASEAVRAVRLKHREPLLAGCARVAVAAPTVGHRLRLLGRVVDALRMLDAPGVQVVRRPVPAQTVGRRVTRRALPLVRWPLVLNTAEAVGLVGLPLGDVHLPGLSLGAARRLPPAPEQPSRGMVLAVSDYPGTAQPLALRTADRLRHAHLIGPTGTGKSTLIANMVAQDLAAGHGIVLIDPRGDLIHDVLDRVPKQRAEDVIVLDPAATDRPVGFNPLAVPRFGDEQARELVIDGVLHVFREIYKAFWGPRTDQVLRTALLTLAGSRAPDGSAFTLCEVPELLTSAAFRRRLVSGGQLPPYLTAYWQMFEALSEGERLQAIGPVLNKINAFVMRSATRAMLGQSTGISFEDVFARRRVLLVSLAKGSLGTETANLVGSLLVSALWSATLARVAVPPNRRRPTFAYIDEFQDVVRLAGGDLADALSQARGLGLALVLAHQYLDQLPPAVASAVLGTARTQVVFQVEYDDATRLAKRFAPALSAEDLTGLETFSVAIRPCVGGRTIAPVTGATLPLSEPVRDGRSLARTSRQRYGRPRAEVEQALAARVGLHGADLPPIRRRPRGGRP